ncbi:unnamed protein product, partial [Rotaria magnacalcarata]
MLVNSRTDVYPWLVAVLSSEEHNFVCLQ